MKLVNHGGKCCGIKTLYEFGDSPRWLCSLETKRIPGQGYRDLTGTRIASPYYDYNQPGCNFFFDAAPAETMGKRFHRLVKYCKRERPKHLIEVVLTAEQLEGWKAVLIRKGFVEVTKFKNSNSGNFVHVFHLAYDETQEKKGKTIA